MTRLAVDSRFDATEHFLAELPLFSALGREELGRLSRGAALLDLSRSAAVFNQGDACAGLHVIVRGQVMLAVETPDGREKVVELLGPGASLGEIPLFLDTSHLFSARTLCATRVLRLGRALVMEEVRRNPEFARQLVIHLCARLYRRTVEFATQATSSGAQRVVDFILSQCDGTGAAAASVLLPAKKGVIASRLNLTQAHFSRILRALAMEQLIEVRGRTVLIRDLARLRERGTK